ncbi:phytoene desaturase family protein [Leucobacter musarum]|uniref:phytoene desaturase family protein n=1 Tax=Leucobacter musarum TaxID=1930747 RepID=UPI0009498EC5|nr:NAD(P)/FAD-dependent oxidoreductase [Leucobacter musarum]
MSVSTDVVVVGSGPNGLAAALTAAMNGLSVHIIEANQKLGGNARTEEMVEGGFIHDVGAAVHPMAVASPFFRKLNIEQNVEFIYPEISYAHAMPNGRVEYAYRSLARTLAELPPTDRRAWARLFSPLVANIGTLTDMMLSPLQTQSLSPIHLHFGAGAARRALGRELGAGLSQAGAGALLAGVEAHAIGASSFPASLVGIGLAAHAHSGGWPIPVGGSQSITDFLVHRLADLGATFELNRRVTSLDELPKSHITLLDVTPHGFLKIAGSRLPRSDRNRLKRFTYGPGIAKLDMTLHESVPWLDSRLGEASTVHLAGDQRSLMRSEHAVARGKIPFEPYVLLSQPSTFDATRAPRGKHVLWAYMHVPQWSRFDPTLAIYQSIERHAPGFRDVIRSNQVSLASSLTRMNANLIGGDLSAGTINLRQILARPAFTKSPWRTPLPGVYLCSASTTPGPGVHGMAGWYAAETALSDLIASGDD